MSTTNVTGSDAMKELLRLAQESSKANRYMIGSGEDISVKTLLTPAMAAKFLEKNHGNRKVKQAWVEKLAEMITAGKWRDNGETIIISNTGRILDGQHRLWAVLLADQPIYVRVVFGVSDDYEIMSSIGQGVGRTVANIMEIVGVETSSTLRSAANLLQLASAAPGGRNKIRPEQADFLLEHMEEIKPWDAWAQEITAMSPMIDRQGRRNRAVSTSALIALGVHMTRQGADPETFQEFMTGAIGELAPAAMRELNDNRLAILKLVNRRLKNGTPLGRPTGGSGINPLLAEFALYIRTYNRYIKDQPLGRMYLTSEVFRTLDDLPLVEAGLKW